MLQGPDGPPGIEGDAGGPGNQVRLLSSDEYTIPPSHRSKNHLDSAVHTCAIT